MKDMSHLLTQA